MSPAVTVVMQKEIGKQQLYYGKNKVPLHDIYKIHTTNLYLRAATPTVNMNLQHNVYNYIYKLACNFLQNKDCLGICKMLHLRACFKISPTVARVHLSRSFRKVVYLGQFCCKDKKQKKWRGRLAHIKKVLEKKNDPVGHWTTQVCVNFAFTSQPFIHWTISFCRRARK